MTDFLTLEDVLHIVSRYGFEVRDQALLESAVARPQTTVFGDDAFPTVYEKAAALLQSLAANQALIDGNKRLAWRCTNVFAELNGIELGHAPAAEADEFIRGIGHRTDLSAIADKLRDWTSAVDITEQRGI